VRFWDPVAEESVAGGLEVTLRPARGPGAAVRAAPNPSGIYVAHRLPGLALAARGAGDDPYWSDLGPRRLFAVEVRDPAERFHPLRFEAPLPARGLFVPDGPAASPPEAAARGVTLYSTALRAAPAGVGVVRAELRHAATLEPVAWAMLAAEHRGILLGWGVADREGRVALMFACPEPERRRILSPPEPLSPPPGAAAAISWNIRLRAFHSPAVAASEVPDYCALRRQPEALLLGRLSPPEALAEITLNLGQAALAATTGKSVLMLAPA
jgi:hypothetical protein